jgi:fermentation-respiration switch protein FrsA (DUF1100 family)
VRLLSRFSYNTLERLPRITLPILVIHSPHDELIPFNLGQRLFEAAKQPKQFLQISGSHNEGFLHSKEVYINGLNLFLSGLKGGNHERD